jgi:heme oxygenase
VLAALTILGVTPGQYRTAMQSLTRAFEEIDSVLLQATNLCPHGMPPYTPRVPSLKRDLIALNVPPHNPRWTPTAIGLKVPETEAAYLGMRYVVEGAQLGSRIIYGQLRAAFGDGMYEFGTFWIPASFPQNSWPSLLQCLARLESRDGLAAAVRSARLTFRHMELFLCVNDSEAM